MADAERANLSTGPSKSSNEQPVSQPPTFTADQLSQLTSLRATLYSSFAQAVLSMMAAPRYRDQTLRDLERLLLEPMVQDRVAVTTTASSVAGSTPETPGDPLGIAIWASVSTEVDEKIRSQISAGVFPPRLTVADWCSGPIVWILDVIAASPEIATAVFVSTMRSLPGAPQTSEPIKDVIQPSPIRLHPIVRQAVGAETLVKLGIRKGGN
jgi:cytolysin-activating lysine-acyltransferase